MSDAKLEIQSHKGFYLVEFSAEAFAGLHGELPGTWHFLIDERVARLYERQLAKVLASKSVLRITADESQKSLDKMEGYIEKLVANKARRDHVLVAIGGGIIQDITCFLASTMFRGMTWHFYPTTLLAQADSCIGSKSSINVGKVKNLLGTFYPPRKIMLSPTVLDTLDESDVRSGVGEMLKVHVIDGEQSFRDIARDYESLFRDKSAMERYIHRSLAIKKRFIEQDEFDAGIRNIFNYGHSFGHAIEAATDFAIPHGLAVTIGMDMANYTAQRLGRVDKAEFELMHETLKRNARGYSHVKIPMDTFLAAIGKDKKNVGAALTLILPRRGGGVEKAAVPNDAAFRTICEDYFRQT